MGHGGGNAHMQRGAAMSTDFGGNGGMPADTGLGMQMLRGSNSNGGLRPASASKTLIQTGRNKTNYNVYK